VTVYTGNGMTQAFGIFEGGGGKGLAHVGALSCAEKNNIDFVGVAGASAGAIVASLLACGYSAKDMFDPDRAKRDDSTKIYAVTLKQLLGPSGTRWQEFDQAVRDFNAIPVDKEDDFKGWRLGWRLLKFKWKHRAIVKSLEDDLGIFDTASLESYLDERLEVKLLEKYPGLKEEFEVFKTAREPSASNRVLFEHMQKPLKIVATDIDNRRIVVLSKETTPDMSVAEAVAASISLPVVFKPKTIEVPVENGSKDLVRVRAIDGGLLSNFPAWLFDSERLEKGPHFPTIGFKLIEESPQQTQGTPEKVLSPLAAHFKSIVGIIINGDPLLETREIENLHEIPLRVTYSTLDFDLNFDQKCELHAQGRASAFAAFCKPGFPRDRDLIETALAVLVKLFRTIFNLPEPNVVRANIICKTTRSSLRVTYCFNMDSEADTDDELEFAMGSGACGQCWETKELVYCDLEAARSQTKAWKMDKYQQAMVRGDLKSLLCAPILDAHGERLGVLNVDSPVKSMLSLVDDEEKIDRFETVAVAWLGELLTRKPEGGQT